MNTFGIILFIFGVLTNYGYGQFSLNGCSEGWISNAAQCYSFVANNPLIIEEADSYCWVYGAKLLVINSYAEHVFIADWLQQNDILFRSTWFTGGYYANDAIVWGTDEVINDAGNYWNVQQQSASRVYNRLAYKIGDHNKGYGWSLVSGSRPANFICEISKSDVKLNSVRDRDYDYGLGFADKNSLPHGPQMITEPKNVLILGDGGITIYLECSASSRPQSKYIWKRQDTVIISSTRYTLSGGRLTIASPNEEEDAGYYQCSAVNDIGTILSSVAQITFGYLHAFSPVKPNDQVGTAFEGVRVSCNTPAYKPAVRYGWFKNHNTHNYIFPGHPVHFVSQSGYLYFSEVQYTDDRTYFCIVTLVTTADFVADTSMAPSRVGLGTKLIIRDGKTDNNYGPIIHTHAFPTPALKGSLVRLECVAYASSPQNLKYKWHRQDGQPFIKGTTLSDRNRVLTIPNAPMEAEGNYICTVTRPASSSRPGAVKSAVITLLLETKPYFADPIGNMLVDPNQDITWRCKSVARPQATYSWYKNGQLIQNVPGKIEAHGNTLTINQIKEGEDEGMYQCSATNQHGTSFSSGELKVLSFKPNFDRFPMKDSFMAPVGGNLTIPCRAEGAPIPDIQWLKNGGPLNVMAGLLTDRIGMTLKNDLVITKIQMNDQGIYICKAVNVNGEATNSSYVSVVQGVVIDKPPLPMTAVLNRTEFLYCAASHPGKFLDVTYQWLFNGHPIIFKHNPHLIQGNKNGLSGIYIREAQYGNAGLYTCVVKTPLHSDSKSALVLVNGPPGQPAGVYLDTDSVTSYSALVVWTWGEESDHGSPVTGFDVEADTNYDPGNWTIVASDIPDYQAVQLATDNGHRPDQRSVEIKNLIPNTSYRFRVRAVNQHGRGKDASRPSVRIKTPATAPYRAPDNLGGGDGSEGTLYISWTPLPPSEHCGPGIGYRVYWKPKENQTVFGQSWKEEVINGNLGEYTAMVGVENYYLPYEVKVQAFNDLGDGPNTTVQVVYSAMGIPSIVPMITGSSGVNISTIIVYWDPIPDDREHVKGRIGGYTIQYYWNDQGCNPMTGCEVTNLRNRNIWGQASEVMLIDLEMNSEFFFRLQVFNSAGRGPKGEWRRGETATWAPLNYPRFVTITSHGPHSVSVSWQGVMTTVNEEIITGYKVKWWEVQSDIRNANETLSDLLQNTVVVHGLQRKTVYQLRVQGVSAGGDGQMSSPVFFTIEGGMIQIDPSTTQFCYEGVTCSSTESFRACYSSYIITVFVFLYTILVDRHSL
ncbi:contactin-3-like [Mercenaria mercenaria]|uniref:contactin-3-like n=1 Tax=Mercenaria mercenaria TaxID=6596 RepID=UPI00234F1859|nr:contactin-3-like [Mercenaria mercenaria]